MEVKQPREIQRCPNWWGKISETKQRDECSHLVEKRGHSDRFIAAKKKLTTEGGSPK